MVYSIISCIIVTNERRKKTLMKLTKKRYNDMHEYYYCYYYYQHQTWAISSQHSGVWWMQILHAFSIAVVNSPSNWSHQENYEIDTAESHTVEGEIWLVKSHESTRTHTHSLKQQQTQTKKVENKTIKFKVTITLVPFMIRRTDETEWTIYMLFDRRP